MESITNCSVDPLTASEAGNVRGQVVRSKQRPHTNVLVLQRIAKREQQIARLEERIKIARPIARGKLQAELAEWELKDPYDHTQWFVR